MLLTISVESAHELTASTSSSPATTCAGNNRSKSLSSVRERLSQRHPLAAQSLTLPPLCSRPLPLSASSIRCLQTACHRRVNMRISQSSRQTRDDDGESAATASGSVSGSDGRRGDDTSQPTMMSIVRQKAFCILKSNSTRDRRANCL